MFILYGADLSTPSTKVRFAAHLLGLEYEYKQISIRDGENRTDEFLKKHPAGKIPVIDDEGFVLFESNAIIKYLSDKKESSLYPKDLKQRAKINQWIDFGSIHVGGAMNRIVFNRVFAPLIRMEIDERSLSEGLKFINRFLPTVENQLTQSLFLAGDALTLADVNLLSILDPAEVADIALSSYSKINTWRSSLRQKDFYTQCYSEYAERLTNFKKRK